LQFPISETPTTQTDPLGLDELVELVELVVPPPVPLLLLAAGACPPAPPVPPVPGTGTQATTTIRAATAHHPFFIGSSSAPGTRSSALYQDRNPGQ